MSAPESAPAPRPVPTSAPLPTAQELCAELFVFAAQVVADLEDEVPETPLNLEHRITLGEFRQTLARKGMYL